MWKLYLPLLLFVTNIPIGAAQTACITEDEFRSSKTALEGIEDLTNDKVAKDFHQSYEELNRLSGDVSACRERRHEAIFSLESCATEISRYNDQVDRYNQIQAHIDNRATYLIMVNSLKKKLRRPRCAAN